MPRDWSSSSVDWVTLNRRTRLTLTEEERLLLRSLLADHAVKADRLAVEVKNGALRRQWAYERELVQALLGRVGA